MINLITGDIMIHTVQFRNTSLTIWALGLEVRIVQGALSLEVRIVQAL